jgi:hypothetical protein
MFVELHVSYMFTIAGPLSVSDLSGAADDGSKVRISFKVGDIFSRS